MINVTKNEKESNERLVLRFNKRVQQSRVLLRARHGRYFKKADTKITVRNSAIMREHYRAKKAKMQYY